jgi:hypothetical protein
LLDIDGLNVKISLNSVNFIEASKRLDVGYRAVRNARIDQEGKNAKLTQESSVNKFEQQLLELAEEIADGSDTLFDCSINCMFEATNKIQWKKKQLDIFNKLQLSRIEYDEEDISQVET